MKRLFRNIISIAVLMSFMVTTVAWSAPTLSAESHLRASAFKNVADQEGIIENLKTSSSGKAKSESEIKQWLKDHKFNLSEPEFNYFYAAYKRFFEPSVPIKIGEETVEGEVRGFTPSAMLTEDQRRELLGVSHYEDLAKNAEENIASAEKAVVILNALDGGLGKSASREGELKQRLANALSGKTVDPAIIKRAEDVTPVVAAKIQELGEKIERLIAQPDKTKEQEEEIKKLNKEKKSMEDFSIEHEGEVYYLVLGAKGVDAAFPVERDSKTYMLGIAEIKVLRLIKDIEAGIYKKDHITYQPLISFDSKPSYVALMEQPCFLYPDRTYGEVLSSLGVIPESIADFDNVIMEEFNTKLLPLVGKGENHDLAESERGAPGGHGQLGMIFLLEALTDKVTNQVMSDGERSYMRMFYNGDGISNMADPTVIGWMVKNKVPIVMITTTRAGIDAKGGIIGIETLADGSTRTQLLEIKQAKNAGQEPIFVTTGLPGAQNEAEPYKQFFNTNVAIINYSALVPILKVLMDTGVVTKQQIIDAMTPDLISNEKEAKDGTKYLCADSALGSALLNLSALFDSNLQARSVLQKLTETESNPEGLTKLVNLVNAGLHERTQFFTPFKKSYDYWFQNYTEYYTLNTSTWMLEDNTAYSQDGPPTLELHPEEADSYGDITYLIEAFGETSVTDPTQEGRALKQLRINSEEGLNKEEIAAKKEKVKPVKMHNTRLLGSVLIDNYADDTVDLTSTTNQPKLLESEAVTVTSDGKTLLDDVTITITGKATNPEIAVVSTKTSSSGTATGSDVIEQIKITSELAATVAKIGQGGTIVFNDTSLPDAQRAILESTLGKNTQQLKELEESMQCTIRLKSQLSQEDISDRMIIISDEKITGYEDAKYLEYKQLVELDNSYIPVIPMVAMAKGLLNLTDKTQVELIDAISALSRNICRIPIAQEIIENFIISGVFKLDLPSPEVFDYQQLENMHKQALLALIAA